MPSSYYCSVCQTSRCTSKIIEDKASYFWTIENFNFIEAKEKLIQSTVFSSVKNDQVKWNLTLKPNSSRTGKDYISLYLNLCPQSTLEPGKKIFALMTFYVLNNEGKKLHEQLFNMSEFSHLDSSNNSWGLEEFLHKDTRFRNKLLFNNILRIRCDVKFSELNEVVYSTQCCSSTIEVPKCDLPETFASLLENQEFTDVVLSANGKDFPAHKAVLSARSPVFRAMFKYSTKENELNRVNIEDINEQVVGEMLKYIYTGKCPKLEKFAEGLLSASDKYDLYRLKMMCAKALLEGLSVENAANVLILADLHNTKDLKREVIKFIIAKFAQVVDTAAWQDMVSSNPQLMNEVCQAIARQGVSKP